MPAAPTPTGVGSGASSATIAVAVVTSASIPACGERRRRSPMTRPLGSSRTPSTLVPPMSSPTVGAVALLDIDAPQPRRARRRRTTLLLDHDRVGRVDHRAGSGEKLVRRVPEVLDRITGA